ncbi:LysR family transcriptional regulator [Aureimonas phyllosphaerae]|uniref:DNA-binding transcriptional LysR family regulator n=1 Tax=Aureimonas phyllosphaerae TaxID=1166078 RepID=A0A7W6FVL2_9HYPH|nr:LysR family transcriptional regulator [Aureimonas phyllosphaerae]MBB3937261.1 DNA-binding transcriptional LysR family regulator [Aureimonas phyllosphaerae]MBB3961268.1 DNA-binding transcriptional LysR family regulator [Aureimonas phyllosphaerae]SFF58088.1 transcriptional regulator, LysR family [Aureimonas phyllosphaerae]
MNIEDILTFIEVAEAGGVSAAARRLGLSKSIVSRRLLRLEEELGAQLVARTTRGAALTEAGSIFREHASRIGAEIEAARDTIRPAGDLRGRLRVAMPLTFGPTHFAPVLADMARRYPLLHIHTVYSDRFVDLVAEGFDCAVRVGYLSDSELLARRVGPIYGTLVASPDYVREHGSPGSPTEISDHPALMQGTETWQFMVEGRVVTTNPQGRFKADSALALATAAAAGLGIAWLPTCIVYDQVVSGALLPIMTNHPPPTAGAYVVRPPGRHSERKVDVLADLLTDLFVRDPHFEAIDLRTSGQSTMGPGPILRSS